MRSFRIGTALMALVLLLPSARAGEKEKPSELSKVLLTEKKDDIEITVLGTRAPDFTSFTMTNPFRVVVDWAGSKINGAPPEQTFERGLIRSVRTKQYDSEAERISRVTIELARETTYRVEAVGTRVMIHFQPVADLIPEPQPKPEPAAKKEEKKDELVYVPEGPLTEPDLPVPAKLPPQPAPAVVAKVDPPKPPPSMTPAPSPVTVAKVQTPPAPPPKPVEQAKPEPKPEPPVVVAKAEPKPAPKVEPKIEPKPEPKVEPKPEPKIVAKAEPKIETKPEPKIETKPEPKSEPKTIATYVPKVQSPAPRSVRTTPPRRTQQIAAWAPPGAGKVRGPAAPKFGVAQETIQPDGETPVDPDEPTKGSSSSGGSGDQDFDPGPRLMKYIGFRQMADVSRVFVRLDGKAKYKQKKEGDTVIVELLNTSVPVKNNTRPLDTSYFNSPVGNVQAVPSGDSTRIEIKLKEQVPFQVKRIGTTLAIDFTRK
jgi:colicin import membrane protein